MKIIKNPLFVTEIELSAFAVDLRSARCDHSRIIRIANIGLIYFLIVLLFLLGSNVNAQQNDEFHAFDSEAMDVRALVSYINKSEWPDALTHISSYKSLGQNRFVYQIDAATIVSGLFYLDAEKKETMELISGFVEWKIKLNSVATDKTYYLVNSGGGTHGNGYSAYSILDVTKAGEVNARMLYSYSYDMVEGFCGRRKEMNRTAYPPVSD